MVKRDRYGEPVDEDLELQAWEGKVAHARRAAREALPERLPEPERRIPRTGLKTRLRAQQRAAWPR